MALVDVTELLSDPDFVDPVTQIKRVSQANSFGENVITSVPFETIGSVQPASGKVINRLPEALRVADVKSFWIKGEITATEPGKYTDIIVCKGKRYQVQSVQDWSNFGEGYCEGTCVMEKPS